MSKHTYKERLVAGLLADGWRREQHTGAKVPGYVKPGMKKVFVGVNGALRTGSCKSSSWSVGDPTRVTVFYKKLLDLGDAALATPQDKLFALLTSDGSTIESVAPTQQVSPPAACAGTQDASVESSR